jgi:hypothetical protein
MALRLQIKYFRFTSIKNTTSMSRKKRASLPQHAEEEKSACRAVITYTNSMPRNLRCAHVQGASEGNEARRLFKQE